MNLEDRLRYNFDFQNERPLEGAYTWTPVKDCEFVPIAYKMGAQIDQENLAVSSSSPRRILKPTARRQPFQLREEKTHENIVILKVPESPKKSQKSRSPSNRKAVNPMADDIRTLLAKKRKQQKVTEFYVQRKVTTVGNKKKTGAV